jgi:hypothetical protein
MENNGEVLLIEDALAMNSKMPLKQIYSCVLCTKDYFFVIPTKSVGMFVIFETVKNHSHFEGLTIYEGLKKLQNDAKDVADLEAKTKDLLENDEKYIFELSQATKLKISGFLGKKTLMYRKGKSWGSFNPKSKAEGKKMAEFYSF